MLAITHLDLPPSPTLSVGSIHEPQEPAPQPRRLRTMIVDDDSVYRQLLSRMLELKFPDLIELSAIMTSGVEALEHLRIEEVDLILMDIDMPHLSGVETTRAIRRNFSEHPILQRNQSVPIIAVTTNDSEEQRELYRQVGMSDCVSKPVKVPKLRSAIESVIMG